MIVSSLMMSPTMKMTTKSSKVMMSSVIGYCCCMHSYVIVVIEIISRICKGILRTKFDNVAYICGNCYFFILLTNKSFNIGKFLGETVSSLCCCIYIYIYIYYNCYFFVLLRN